jgi:ParB family chromosome partitioning protein
MAKGDDTGALEASLIENVARQPMDELQEYEAYAKLLKQGRKVEEIAATFGVSELRVKQRLAIASLHPKIKEAFPRRYHRGRRPAPPHIRDQEPAKRMARCIGH